MSDITKIFLAKEDGLGGGGVIATTLIKKMSLGQTSLSRNLSPPLM